MFPQGPADGWVSNGVGSDLDLSVPIYPFLLFRGFPHFGGGFFHFSFLSWRAKRTNQELSPKNGKPPVWETPGFPSPAFLRKDRIAHAEFHEPPTPWLTELWAVRQIVPNILQYVVLAFASGWGREDHRSQGLTITKEGSAHTFLKTRFPWKPRALHIITVT